MPTSWRFFAPKIYTEAAILANASIINGPGVKDPPTASDGLNPWAITNVGKDAADSCARNLFPVGARETR